MALTAGAVSVLRQTPVTATVKALAASGGTGPYTYQWYMSQTSGFTPGGGNILSGATTLEYLKTGLTPNQTYYFILRSTDTGDSNATVDSAQLAVVTSTSNQSQNQFGITALQGMLDQPFNYNTKAAQVDASNTVALFGGYPVKIVDSAGGVPKVVACSAATDEVWGYVNYNQKNPLLVAGDALEISQDGNVMWLYAQGAIARGAQVALSVSPLGVVAVSGSGGENIVGRAYDKASAAGELIRVMLQCPSGLFDA